jgi:hypothetical protein
VGLRYRIAADAVGAAADVCVDNASALVRVVGLLIHVQVFKYVIIKHNIFIYFC